MFKDEAESESSLFISSNNVRQCQRSVAQVRSSWDSLVSAAISVAQEVDPFKPDLQLGVEVSACDAYHWNRSNVDIRPRLVDKSSGIARLIDTGSQISVTAKKSGDKIDDSVKLIAVNGSKIDTFGVREIEFKIGRKSYKMSAVICDVDQDILGMDFMNKFKLNLEWNEVDQSELHIVDRKAQIRSQLQIITVPLNLQRVHSMNVSSSPSNQPAECQWKPDLSPRLDNETIQFQVSCMKKLDKEIEAKKTIEEQLLMHDPKYVRLIKKYPQLLSPSFVKGEPVHGVFHRIDTAPDAKPCTSKRRPLITNKAKAAAGKEAWEQMAKDGIIEKVKAGSKTDYTSALHLVDKPGGGCRPCSDFRLLNHSD